MKNKYKAPKQKKSKGAKPKWRYWMTVACVFGGVGAVLGGTILGVFATGGFNEKQISPEVITFDCNPELFNFDYSQLEVTDSNGSGVFELLISTPTEEVTEKRVKLSFNDSYPVTKAGGFISNTVIQVPEYVTIGQPFSAKMLTESLTLEDNSKIDWIKGGISLLHAESTDEVFADLKIAVDTPVYTTKTVVYDSNGEKINLTVSGTDSYYEILAGEKFTAESIFVPAKSEYMFADDSELNDIPQEQRRKKHSFFAAALLDSQANAVTPQYIDKHTVEFVASNQIQAEPVAINAFTFKYADTELTFNEENSAKEALEFYNTAITTLNGKGQAWKSPSAVMIGDAGIEEFSVINKATSTIVRGQNLSIYAVYNASQPKAQYLGASVTSNTGRYLDGMLANIGIRFINAGGKDVTIPGDDQLLEIDSNCEIVVYDGKTYYLPNSNVANIEKSYWNIHAKAKGTEGDQDVTMEILLFTSISTPVKVFEADKEVVVFSKTLKISDFEKDVYEWKSDIPTNYTLSYIGSECQKQIVNLRDFVDVSTQEQIKFLVQFADENEKDDDYEINKMLGQTSYYGKYTIDGISDKIYILKESTIALGDTGNFDIYFAVVNPNYNPGEDGYIKTLNIEKQTFTCKKALYDGSITQANIKLNIDAPKTEKFVYVGSDDDSFKIDFVIAGDSKPAFEEKYKLNRNNFAIVLYDGEGNDITNYFTYTLNPELALYDEGDTNKNGIQDGLETFTGNYVLTVEFTLKDNQQIKTDYFVPFDVDGSGSIEEGEGYANSLWIDKNSNTIVETGEIFESTIQVARVTMSFEDATTEKLTWGLVYDEDEDEMVPNDNFKFNAEKLYVYSPIATSITTNSAIVNNSASKIEVSQTLGADGEFDTSIKNPICVDEVALAQAIAGNVVIKDQHNDETSLAGQWKFITNNPEIIKVSGDGKSFTFGTADGESAMIQIQSADGKVIAINECWLTLTTKGVAQMQTNKNADEDFGDAGEEKTTDVTQAKVTIDGSKDVSILDITNLVKYYLDGGASYNPTLTASLNSKTTSITDIQKTSLFGYVYTNEVEDDDKDGIIASDEYEDAEKFKGWIEMLDKNGNTIYAICSLSGDGSNAVIGFTGDITKIASIKINNNFAKKETISFNITAKGISTTLDIEILPVASIEGEKTSYTIYAGKEYDGIDGTIETPGNTADPFDVQIGNTVEIGSNSYFLFDYYFSEAGKSDPLYICPSGNGYIVSATDDDNNSVAQITKQTPYNGESYITFNDFWNEDVRQFTIEFTPDGNNYYAISKTIVFTVQRNVKVSAYSNSGSSEQDLIDVQENTTLKEYFNLYGTSDVNPASYLEFKRIAQESIAIPDIFSYATKVDGVLQIDETTDNLIKNGISINFALQEYIEQEIYLFCEIDDVKTKFATAKFKVRPLENIYDEVAKSLKSSDNNPAKVQTVNGQKYIVVDIANNETSGWTLENPLRRFDKEKLTIINRYPGGTVRTPLYSGNSGLYNFAGNLSALAGYNSTDKIIVQLSHENYAGVYEYIYLNAIVSSVGNNPVIYENNGNTINSQAGADRITNYTSRYLEVAMMTPDKLIEKGIYDEVYAGRSYDLFVTSGNGLFGAGTAVAYVGIGAEDERITNKLIKQLPSTTKNLELYDLADNLGKDYYISFKYTIKNQDFYYVLKVLPNVHSLDPLYPFDGNFENLQENSGKIWLDEPFNNETLHNGEVRFNVVRHDPSTKSLKATFTTTRRCTSLNIMHNSGYQYIMSGTQLKLTYNGQSYYYTHQTKIPRGNGNTAISFSLFKTTDGTELVAIPSGATYEIEVINGYATLTPGYGTGCLEVAPYTSLSFIDKIAQVTIDDSKILLNEAEWSKYITAKIVVEGGKSYLSYEAKDSTTPIKVLVRRTFVTSASAEIEQIVDGSIDYVFAINDQSKDYSIRFEKATDATTKDVVTLPDNFGATEYEITFRNGSSFYGLDNTDHKYTGLKVYLVENAVVGDTTSGTVVKDIVRVQKSQDDNNIISDVSYTNTGTNNGMLTLTLADYIPQDSTVIFTIFTSYGHIATIKLNVLANAEADYTTNYKVEIPELVGGGEYSIGTAPTTDYTNIADIKVDNEKFVYTKDSYSVDILVKDDEGDFVENNQLIINNNKNENLFGIADITHDRTVELKFVITFNSGTYSRRKFSFTKTFKLRANVVAGKAQRYEKEIIAEEEFQLNMTGNGGFNLTTLFETGKAPENISGISVATANEAYKDCTVWDATDKKITFDTNYVSIKTVVATRLTVTLNSGETIDLNFSFTVVPAVEFSTNYPNPTGEGDGELEMEYVDGNYNDDYTKGVDALGAPKTVKGFKIDDLESFLIEQTAQFASDNRIVINSAITSGNTVVYSGSKLNTVDSIVITSLSNIDVYRVTAGSGELSNALPENKALSVTDSLLLVRGSKTNEHSILKLTVECKGVSHDYVIYVSSQLWTAQENYVTSNKIAGQYPEALSWTVTLKGETNNHDHTTCTDPDCIGLTESEEYNETSNPNGYITKYIFDFPASVRNTLKDGEIVYVEVDRAVDTWETNPHQPTPAVTNKFHIGYAYEGTDYITKISDNGKGKSVYQFTYHKGNRADGTPYTGYNTFWVYDGNVGDKFTFTRVQNNITAEKIYVDKTNVDNMLADDRMVTATIAGSAQVGEYYLAYTDNDARETYTANLSDEYHLGTTVLRNGSIMTVTMHGVIKFTYNGVEYENTLANKSKTIEIEYVDDVDIINVVSEDSTAKIEFIYNPVFYISNSFYVRQEDLGKTLTLDLGLSMSGKTFYGVFKVEDLKNAGIGYKSYSGTPARQITYSADSPALDALTKQGVFASAPVLGNRVQLYYGEPLASYKVASDKYEFAEDFSCNNGSDQTLDTIYEKELTLKVGSLNVVSGYKYYYMPAIDIALTKTEALAGAGSSIAVEANKEYKSISELFGLIHPSTGQYLSPADADNVEIKLETVADEDAQGLTFYDSYKSAKGFEEFKTTASGRQYLYIGDVQYGSKTYDFTIVPQGADADGDYCLLKITYKVGGFTKEYYVVINILPDYNVKFGGEGGQVDSEGVISNQNAPYIVSVNEDSNVYPDFTLAGAGGYLSITHNNTESKEEIALSGFKIHLPVKDDSADENNKVNIKNKIAATLGVNMFKLSDTVLSSGTTLANGNKCEYDYSADSDKKITLSNVPVTVFTSQTFFIEGEDDFGYRYRLYFTLPSKGNQPKAITEGLVINETKGIDIGLQYQLLNVSIAEGSGEATISSTQMAPTSTADIPVINIAGIDAWLFNHAPGLKPGYVAVVGGWGNEFLTNTTGTTEWQFISDSYNPPVGTLIKVFVAGGTASFVYDGSTVSGQFTYSGNKKVNINTTALTGSQCKVSFYVQAGITLDPDGKWSTEEERVNQTPYSVVEESRGYLAQAAFTKVTVEGIKIYTAEGDVKVGEFGTPAYGNLATSSDATYFGDPGTTVFGSAGRAPANNWEVPRIPGEHYGSSNKAKFILKITLKYDANGAASGGEEYCTIPVSVEIARGIDIVPTDNSLAIDGEEINVADQFVLSEGSATYINDTLEFVVKPNSVAKFNISAKRNIGTDASPEWKDIGVVGIVNESNTGVSAYTTKYISISQYIGTNIQANDVITISNVSNVQSFYYITSDAGTVTGNTTALTATCTTIDGVEVITYTFTTGEIVNDYIYIENQALLEATLYKNVTKYYIAKVNLDGDKYYRVARDYTVTGFYFSFKPGYTGSIGQTIGNASGGGFAVWSNITAGTGDTAFIVEKAAEAVSGKITGSVDTVTENLTSNLEFEIVQEAGSSYGKATMSDGRLDITSLLAENEYISVAVYMKVSGLDRDKATNANEVAISRIRLGVVRLALKP